MLKAPKKPGANASAAALKKYLERYDKVASENARRTKENSEREGLLKKVSALNGVPMKRSGSGTGKRKNSLGSNAKKRKPAAKKKGRR